MRPWLPIVVTLKACAITLVAVHHVPAGLILFFAPDPWIFLQFILPDSQAFGPAVTSFSTQRREVWLTIDDGPDPLSTPQVLDLLKAHDAKATFFVVGSQVKKHPELVRQIVAHGHTIANHSASHPAATFWMASPARTAAEIDGCVAQLLIAGVPFERYFRPPVGVRNPFLNRQLLDRAMQLVLWNARGFDGSGGDMNAALARIVPRIQPGGVLLSHEGGPDFAKRLQFLGLLLEHLSRENYTCVLPWRSSLLC